MKKVKAQKTQQKAPMSHNTKILLYALAGIVVLAVIAMILVEGSASQILISNKSELKLESVETDFRDAESIISEKYEFENIENGETVKEDLEKMDFSYSEATIRVGFKFDGYEEMFVDTGYFNDQFNGKIKIDFSEMEDGNILLKVKASGGIIPSPNIICDEEHIIYLKEGYVE